MRSGPGFGVVWAENVSIGIVLSFVKESTLCHLEAYCQEFVEPSANIDLFSRPLAWSCNHDMVRCRLLEGFIPLHVSGEDGRALVTEVVIEADAGIKWEDDDCHQSIAKHDNVDWKAVDDYRLVCLNRLLAHRGLIILGNDELHVVEGFLWDDLQLKHIVLILHSLSSWPDTCRGLWVLNEQFTTVTLSNTYNDLMRNLVKHSRIQCHHVFTSDVFDSFKPNPKLYLGAAEKLGVEPEECALVAAHLGDLKGAKACGFYVIYVERALEEKTLILREENIPDLQINESEEGFIALARQLREQIA
nr:(s)-2-haloacid dehalogenase 1 [Quercus suber]